MGEKMAVNFTITISDEENKALTYDIVDIQEWIQNAIQNKARQCTDVIIEETTDQNPKNFRRLLKQRL
jgi:phosphoserine aminotransferase